MFTEKEIESISKVQKLLVIRSKAIKKVSTKRTNLKKHQQGIDKTVKELVIEEGILDDIEINLAKLRNELIKLLSIPTAEGYERPVENIAGDWIMEIDRF